ncbi:MAG: DNA replication/repair protein RecF [bacterium]
MIQSLTIENFRNYDNLKLAPVSGVNVFVGQNGSGKTNLIESILYLSRSSSPRTKRDNNLIKWGSTHTFVEALIKNKEDELTISSVVTNNGGSGQKVFKHNGVICPQEKNTGTLPVTNFTPDDVTLLVDPPVKRRAYMDSVLSNLNRSFPFHLSKYKHSLVQRNYLLKRFKPPSPDELEPWNKKLAEHGLAILEARLELIGYLQSSLGEIYNHFEKSAFKPLSIKYFDSLADNANETPLSEEFYLQQLKSSFSLDLRYKATQLGPHRDDYSIWHGSKNLCLFGSRGEWRSLVLALKVCELNFIERKRNLRPILLLDDVYSELDKSRRQALMEIIKDQQTFITTTESSNVTLPQSSPSEIYEVAGGELKSAHVKTNINKKLA